MSRVKPSGRSAVPPQSKASSTPSTRSVSHSVVDSPARPLASIDVYEQLKCASCMCPFDLNQRYPKLLGCTHSVCLQCLQFASQQVESIHCPYCDAVTPLPSLDEVHELLDNFFVCDLIDRTAPSSSSKSFQRASSAGPKGAAYDNDDDHVDHDEFLDRDSEADMEHQRRISQINTKCSNHDEDLKYVCNLCQVPVCVSCTVMIDGGHHGHGMISLDKGRRAAVKNLPAQLVSAAKRIDELQTSHESISLLETQLQTSRNETVAAISAHFDRLIAQLAQRRDELCAQVDASIGRMANQAGDRCKTIELRQQFLIHCVAYAEREMRREKNLEASLSSGSGGSGAMSVSNSNASLMTSLTMGSSMTAARSQSLTERVVLMTHAQKQLHDSLERSAQIIFAPRPESAVAAFEVQEPNYSIPKAALGELSISSISLADTIFETDLTVARAGDEVEVIWQLCDVHERPMHQSGWIWSAMLHHIHNEHGDSKQEEEEEEEVDDLMIPPENFTDLGEGRYSVRFIATDGSWNLVISASGSGESLPSIGFFVSSAVSRVATISSGSIGCQGQGDAQFCNPVGVDLDAEHNILYVADCWNHRIQALQFDDDGGVGLLWQHGESGKSGSNAQTHLYRPRGIARGGIDNQNLFVVDQYNHRVVVLRSADGQYVRHWGTKGSGLAQFNNPWGVCATEELVWVADSNNHRVVSYRASDGRLIRQIGTTGSTGNSTNSFNYPTDVAMIDGQLFVADYNNHRVQVFDPSNGEFLCSIGDGVPGKAEGQFNQPQGLGIDSERGLLYVCEFGNKRISVFSTGDYSYRGFLGSEGTGDGEFSYPTDVCIDSFRKLAYVSDFNMHQIKILEALEE